LTLPLLGLLIAMAPTGAPPLFQPTIREGLVHPEPDPAVLRQRRIAIDLNVLRDPQNTKITLNLFGAEVPVIRDKRETPRANTLIWYGRVDGQPGSMVLLSNVADAVAGDITTRDRDGRFRFYQIRYLGNGVHVLSEVDPSRLPPEAPPNSSAMSPTPPNLGACGDSASIIDVLVVYTGRARIAAGSTSPGITNSGIEAEIYEAVASTNLAYANSQISQQLRLVHMEEVSYSETDKTPTQILTDLQNSAGGLNQVLTLRNTYAADIVALIVSSLANACGKSTVMDDVVESFESQAYAVVRRNCSVTKLTFGHELGHIMGAEHEWGIDPTPSVTPSEIYSHGYIQRVPTPSVSPWHTIMAIDKNCLEDPPVNCGPRLPYFSNPSVSYPPGSGDPTGFDSDLTPSDNHRRLNETALTVANFRCASTFVNNVWMKDADDDTGKEPDPQTAAEDMWKSPAIWVRNAQDSSGAHRHDHENPRAGVPNWVYVEMQNGGGQVFGELETYFANASTSLLWPAGWTLISKTLVQFTPSSTRIVEVPWTPPESGHFCLLARWSSPADPMTVPETENIEANVRGNNNLVWKNVNVIDLTGAQSAKATFVVRPPADGSAFSIVVRGMESRDGAPAAAPFRLAIELDEALVTAWRRGGARAQNLRFDGKRFSPGEPGEALLSNLHLERGATARVTVTFERSNAAPHGDIVVDMVERHEDAGPTTRPIGGVSYVVRTLRGDASVP